MLNISLATYRFEMETFVIYGDYWEYDGQNLSYNVNIFDVMRLIEIVETSDLESCGYEAGDLTGEGEVNIFDIYALVGYLMDGLI